MKIAGRVRLSPVSNEQLKELHAKRALEGNPVSSNTSIIAELLAKAHKKECK